MKIDGNKLIKLVKKSKISGLSKATVYALITQCQIVEEVNEEVCPECGGTKDSPKMVSLGEGIRGLKMCDSFFHNR